LCVQNFKNVLYSSHYL